MESTTSQPPSLQLSEGSNSIYDPQCFGTSTSGTNAAITVELYENQRYAPILGYSREGLLPTDYGPISCKHGTISFSSTDIAEEQMASFGWSWTGERWEPDMQAPAPSQDCSGKASTDGWLYNVDFAGPQGYSAKNEGHCVKSVTHFVRRRRITRSMVFTGCDETSEEIVAIEAGQVACYDCQLVDHICGALLQGLWVAVQNSKRKKDSQVFTLICKRRVVDALLRPSVRLDTATLASDELVNRLCAPLGSPAHKSVFRRKSSPPSFDFNPSDPYCRLVEQQFPLLERAGLARAAIRKYDGMFEYHCNAHFCGAACPLAVHRCPHAGCEVRFSKRWWGEHDAACPFKVVPCALQCGMFMPRNRCAEHARDSCIMRRVPCPYATLGCPITELLARGLEAHCRECMAEHLRLAVERVEVLEAEQSAAQAQIRDLTQQVHIMNRR